MNKGTIVLGGIVLLVIGGVFLFSRKNTSAGFTPGFGMGYYGGFHDTGNYASPNTAYGLPFYGGFIDENKAPQRAWAMPWHGGII